uniref:Thioredoxin-related protein n=1 Tax=Candidatus Kentrum sp. DK TaxID=2126562 RepID=A0A450SA18_9GAMM|nr:MAG: Thioredoxin-related protein [Candidatus Kentron sp. DK]
MIATILVLGLMLLASTFVWADADKMPEPNASMTQAASAPEQTANQIAPPPVIADDGLHKQPWFLDSFLELADDLAEAQAQGKRFAIVWEQKGCPYCEELHTANFAKPEINRYVRDNFVVLQLNLWGDRQVTDFDGEVLAEKALARKWGVVFTPTIHFFVEKRELKSGESGLEPGNKQLAATMPGYFRPFHFARMFEYVRDRQYERLHFQKYVAEKVKEKREAGKDVDI